MMPPHHGKSMEQVIREDGRYPPAAFAFLHEGLSRAVRAVHGEDAPARAQVAAAAGMDRPRHHVSGQQLCQALRRLAIERWGLLARTVLHRWNIHSTTDFGKMVYLLVDWGFMRTSEGDSIEDFRDVFDFERDLSAPTAFELKE